MLPVTVSITIDACERPSSSAPREAPGLHRPSSSFASSAYRRPESAPRRGFAPAPGRRVWMETVIEEPEPPHRILEGGHGADGTGSRSERVGTGRRSRVHYRRIADLLDRAVTSHRSTKEHPGARGWYRRRWSRAPPDAGSARVGQPRRAARRRGRRPDPRPATRGPALGAPPSSTLASVRQWWPASTARAATDSPWQRLGGGRGQATRAAAEWDPSGTRRDASREGARRRALAGARRRGPGEDEDST